MDNNSFLNKNIITLILTHFLWGFVNYHFRIQIQPYLLDIYLNAEFLGFILSIGSLSAVFPLLLGFLADRFGRKKQITGSLFLSIIGIINLTINPPTILSSLLGIIMFNLGIGLYDPPLQGLIHESSMKKRGLAYSLIYNSSSVAGIIAAFLIQFQGSSSLNLQFTISAIFLILAALINSIFLEDVKPNTQGILMPLKRIFNSPRAKLIILAFSLDAFSWGLALSIANGLFILLFGINVSFIATLSFIQTLTVVIFQYPAGYAIDRYSRLLGLMIGEITGISWIILIILAIFNPENAQIYLIMGYIMLGISVAFWVPALTLSFISVDDSNKDAASTNFGITAFITRMGWVPTAAISGFIFKNFGYIPLLILTLIGTLIVMSLFWKINEIEKLELSKKRLIAYI